MISYSKVALHSVEEETIKHPEALRYDISKAMLKMLKFAWLEKRFNCRTNPELWAGGYVRRSCGSCFTEICRDWCEECREAKSETPHFM